MNNSWIIPVILLILFALYQQRKRRKYAAMAHHRKHHKNEEAFKMKELAQQFIGKECLVYTIASDSSSIKGTIKEVTNNGLLIESDGNLQAVNLEYITRIREWPRNAKGKKKTVFD